MNNMAKNDITVKLSKARVIGSAGFGVPLIIQGKANAAKDYAEYDSCLLYTSRCV